MREAAIITHTLASAAEAMARSDFVHCLMFMPAERRTIAVRLVILAALGVIAQIISIIAAG